MAVSIPPPCVDGEFGRTPRINGNAGHAHHVHGWSGCWRRGFQRGVGGKTNEDGTRSKVSRTLARFDASVPKIAGVSLKTRFTAKNGPADEESPTAAGH